MGSIWAMKLDWPNVAGGVSSRGEFCGEDGTSGLNISYHVNCNPETVRSNRGRILHQMGCEDCTVVRPHQVHGNRIVTVTPALLGNLPECPSGLEVPETDGLITQLQGVVLNLAYADCVPVMLHCPKPLTIGVLHAGWRGTAKRIAAHGVEVMEKLGCEPAKIEAAIGPAICGQCYEVGPEVIDAMRDLPGAKSVLETPPADHVDLKELNRLTLLASGVPAEAVEVSSDCTVCGPASLFSYRKSNGRTGLHGAFVAIGR